MRYSTRVLLLQLATVVTVVAVCTGVFCWIAYDRLRDEAATTAMGIARSVATSPQVRESLAEDREPSVDSDLQRYAEDATARTGALFVVVSDDHGIRQAHPEPDRLGETVSTDYEPVLRGEEVTAWESGTLGPSARAKTPVYAPGESAENGDNPVGGISVGFRQSGVFDDLPRLFTGVGAAAVGALVLGVAASLLIRRRWEHVTLGLQPEEMTELVRAQSAVLDGVEDGVLSLDTDGIVQVINPRARELLDCGDMVGRPVSELGLPDDVDHAAPAAPVVRGDRVLYLDTHPVRRDGRDLGTVIVVRDRTDIETLSRRLGTVQAMGGALRVQRHEFANRVHVAAGLLDAGRTADARDFLGEMADRGPVDFPLENSELLSESFLQSFLGAKSTEAAEKGITMRIGEDTLVFGTIAPVSAVEDLATVLGNLVDNAMTAAVAGVGDEAGPWVEVTALQDADSLTLVVADSGPGVGGEVATDDDAPDPVHGHGIGLALSRDLLRRRGGELWLIDAGGEGSGAVFGVRLPGVVQTRGEGDDGDGSDDGK
ncbi:MAG TPA: sensor histidine kinase [Candidatus Corynebacterium avicola]|uniref:Sensor-like histidine kinase SenX3 n=1 Tax=Candidatus Corynebacterium avicola TaxID=2838527 RepID=A0A9D1RRH7_9CORY|nr:sensor histidine kinase [Candidatus Corynebacterium avicola]